MQFLFFIWWVDFILLYKFLPKIKAAKNQHIEIERMKNILPTIYFTNISRYSRKSSLTASMQSFKEKTIKTSGHQDLILHITDKQDFEKHIRTTDSNTEVLMLSMLSCHIKLLPLILSY